MAIDQTASHWRLDPSTLKVMAALGAEAGLARFVGGCVRNTLLDLPVTDIDIATVHPPEETIRRLLAANLKAKPTGIAHGTVTAVAGGRPFEITTLRRDVETDGRHAVVAFTDDWAEDASRRDFTMNALFMDLEGRVLDPIGGAADAREGRVRFVGDPDQRIREDVLRILRFFRFQAQYGRCPQDSEGLAACQRRAAALVTLSGERIAAELLKLLTAQGALPALEIMRELAILAALFPGDLRVEALGRMAALERDTPDPIRRLATLLTEPASVVAERLKLSRARTERLAAMAADRVDLSGDAKTLRASLYALGADRFRDAAMLIAVLEDVNPARLKPALDLARTWPVPTFPLRGADLLRLGLAPGEGIGRLLAEIEAWWIANDFTGDRAACLERARAVHQPGRDQP